MGIGDIGDILFDFVDDTADLWYISDVFGKVIAVIYVNLYIPLLLLELCVWLLLFLIKSVIDGVVWLCFPSTRFFRKEIPLPSDEDLQKLRNSSVEFAIGKDYIVFYCSTEYRKAQKIIN